jgi:putative ABC transport system substrate-binding protein
MRRREFITLVGGAAASWPLNVRGEQREPMRRIGILMHTSGDDLESRRRITTLLQALQKLGWTDGQNVRIDYRWAAGDTDRARVFAKELIELKPDVLFANGSPQAPAALVQATRSIPIVFVNISDPVGAGLVANLARPGGNVTGFSNGIFQIAGEQLELLKEIAPSMTGLRSCTCRTPGPILKCGARSKHRHPRCGSRPPPSASVVPMTSNVPSLRSHASQTVGSRYLRVR